MFAFQDFVLYLPHEVLGDLRWLMSEESNGLGC